jgi:c-di-GMP-binding flagellar brake protein YcgR
MSTAGDILQGQFNIDQSSLIPIGTQVELELYGTMSKLKSICVGAIPEDCLIFKYPSISDQDPVNQKLFERNKITVRYVDRGNVFTFQSELLGIVTNPVKLIFVPYPEVILRHGLRKVQRVGYPLFAEVDVNHERFDGLIRDISIGGCRLSIIAKSDSQILPNIIVDQALSIHCTLPGIEEPAIITAQAKSVECESQSITIGAAFHNITHEVHDMITSFISGIQKVSLR